MRTFSRVCSVMKLKLGKNLIELNLISADGLKFDCVNEMAGNLVVNYQFVQLNIRTYNIFIPHELGMFSSMFEPLLCPPLKLHFLHSYKYFTMGSVSSYQTQGWEVNL